METEKVAVEQIDQDAAHAWWRQHMAHGFDSELLEQAFARHRLSAEARSSGRGGVGEDALREALEKLAKKHDGYGMSFHSKGLGGRGSATLNLYGPAALAAYWLMQNGAAALSQQPTATEGPFQYSLGNCLRGYYFGDFATDDEAWDALSERFNNSYPSRLGREVELRKIVRRGTTKGGNETERDRLNREACEAMLADDKAQTPTATEETAP